MFCPGWKFVRVFFSLILLSIVIASSPVEAKAAKSRKARRGTEIHSVMPASGPIEGGTIVVIRGFKFSRRHLVYFGSQRAIILKSRKDSIVAVSPAGLQGEEPVSVRVIEFKRQKIKSSAELSNAFYYTVASNSCNDACSFLQDGLAVERLAVSLFRNEFSAILRAAQPGADGLLGHNKDWGMLVSPRFQDEAGPAVRIAVALGDAASAQNAFRAIEIGMTAVSPETGEVVSHSPPGSGEPLRFEESMSAASFFLGASCVGMLAAKQSPESWGLVTRVNALLPVTDKALQWFIDSENSTQVLAQYDSAFANRLLLDARAFLACGLLLERDDSLSLADTFLDRALALQTSNGVLLEAGGHDTSYQSVSISALYDMLALSNTERCRSPLFNLATAAATWLNSRVRSDGTVDSSGNTRTCEGGESFLGNPKMLNIVETFKALAYISASSKDLGFEDSARAISSWYQRNTDGNSCH